MDNSDKELIELSQTGDNLAFTELIKKYEQNIYTLCYRITNNVTEAKDIYQETFLNAFKNIRQFKRQSEFATWLHRIAINCWKQRVRYSQRHRLFQYFSLTTTGKSDDSVGSIEVSEKLANGTENIEKSEKVQIVQKVLANLAEDERMIIVLCAIEEKSYQEISIILSCPVGTVRSRLARAREKFRKTYKQYIDSNGK